MNCLRLMTNANTFTAIAIGAAMLLTLSACGRAEHRAAKDDDQVLILAAASTQDALEEIAEVMAQRGGPSLIVSPAGSNALAQQILAGAPGDLFLSANPQWADHVERQGHAAKVVPLLGSDLVLVTPRDNPARVHHPRDLLSDRVSRVALAGEHVPAGQYAQQALRRAGVFDELVKLDRIARGQNVRFTLAYVQRGEVQAGVVYAADAAATANVETVFTFAAADHDPIVYPLVLLKRGSDRQAAREVYAFLQSSQALGIFQKHGFRALARTNEQAR